MLASIFSDRVDMIDQVEGVTKGTSSFKLFARGIGFLIRGYIYIK